ncbi:unnamed protein product, partial [Brenthis ino]
MEIPDSAVGRFILVTTLTVYCILVFWINSYPFIDEDLSIYNYIPDPQWVLLGCAVWGFFFIGGVSGVTCGGKTTLANRLQNLLTPVYVFHQDKYFYPDDSPKHVKCEGLDHNNYDILSSLDMEAMFDDITKTINGEDRAHVRNLERSPGKLECKGKKFMVIEGFTVLNYKPIMEICNLRYYLLLEYGACASRRALRLYVPPDVPGYFERCVWPAHLTYRAQIEKDQRVTLLDGARADALQHVIAGLAGFGVNEI